MVKESISLFLDVIHILKLEIVIESINMPGHRLTVR